jgi:bacteriocin biosynthesis cyclodehydratase domain-containing protein
MPLVGEEKRSDVFYWTLQSTAADAAREVGSPRLAVMGVNAVSAELVSGLRGMGLADIVVVDHPLLQNVDFVDSSGTPDSRCWPHDPPVDFDSWADAGAQSDLIVATSDFGGLSTMREWNEFCLNQNVPFFSAVLHDYVGYAGPLVVPRSTACFECLIRRQDSNLESPLLIRATDDVAFQGQIVDGMLPFSARLLGSIAAFEIYRYFARSTLGWRADTVIEIDLLASTMKPRKFLRLPRCPVCGTGSRSGRVAVERVELPGNPQEA